MWVTVYTCTCALIVTQLFDVFSLIFDQEKTDLTEQDQATTHVDSLTNDTPGVERASTVNSPFVYPCPNSFRAFRQCAGGMVLPQKESSGINTCYCYNFCMAVKWQLGNLCIDMCMYVFQSWHVQNIRIILAW